MGNYFLRRFYNDIVVEQGWRKGTTLENQVAYLLYRFGHRPDQIAQQYKIGKYFADFAHVKKRIVIEADGWWHRSPEGAAKDAERDSWMRANGWVVFRVDDRHGEDALVEQVGRVSRMLHAERFDWDADYRQRKNAA